MQNLIRVQNLEEPVYLKKSSFGYRVVHPLKNPDGSWNFINIIFGGIENLITLIIVLLIILSFMYGVREMLASCNDMAANPCKYINTDCSRYYNPQNLVEAFDLELGDVKGNE